jgi:hypothetical protein
MLKNNINWIFGIGITLSILFILYLLLIVKIGPINYDKNESLIVTGIVDDLYEAGVKDLVFKLKDDSNIYYINRALENGFDLDLIKTDLLGERITIWHSNSRSIETYHMLQFKYQDSIYYTEWDLPLASEN